MTTSKQTLECTCIKKHEETKKKAEYYEFVFTGNKGTKFALNGESPDDYLIGDNVEIEFEVKNKPRAQPLENFTKKK
jgi:hypothetical protein